MGKFMAVVSVTVLLASCDDKEAWVCDPSATQKQADFVIACISAKAEGTTRLRQVRAVKACSVAAKDIYCELRGQG